MPAPSVNRTTRFEYDLEGNLVRLTAENAETGDQVTEWIYGVGAAEGSKLESASLLYQKVYPGGTSGADRVTYRYNRQGQVIGMTDQAGTRHDYSFDKFGRISKDSVTAFGSAIDSTVKTIARSYEVRGMLETVTSLGAGGTPLNQVQLSYNDYSQLSADYQAHSGVVNPSTTLQVGYGYADGSANTVRRTGLNYPDGATLTTAYGGTAADALSRPDALKEGSATLCSYRYLGRSTVVGVKYDAASNVELTYQDGGTGGAGDPYTGLDRFGRLIETLWQQGGAQPVRSQYGRNRFSGVVWRRDAAAHALGVSTEDSYYLYDGLYQVQDHQRGELTGTAPNYTGITNLQQEEEWTYDATGNWEDYSNSSPANTQSRTHNEANEITLVSAAVGNVTPSYDPAGNMTTLPKAPGTATGQYALKWDAWNRLIKVKDGSTAVASYSYDGLTRRLTKTNAAETRHYYYNDQWRALEERVAGASVAVERRYTWGLRDRWDLLRRQRSTGGGSLNETHFVLRDYLDPVAIVGTDGLVKERYRYDAFGRTTILAPDYSTRTASICAWDFLFHAEFLDADTGLYNYGYRYYDTGLGRWLSRDPIGEEGGLNLFVFIENSPPFQMDSYGLIEVRIAKPVDSSWACLRNAQRAFNSDPFIKIIVKKMRAKKCDLPYIVCKCCPDRYLGGTYIRWEGKVEKPNVVLCWNNVHGDAEIGAVLRHEMVHALQSCTRKKDKEDCREHLCDEIEAYYAVNCAHVMDPKARKDCVRGTYGDKGTGVGYSVSDSCTQAEFDALFDELYHNCATKHKL